MAAPLDSLEGKVEYAILAELSDNGLEEFATLLCGHEFEEKEGSQVAITCFGGPEVAFNTGTYLKRVRVAVRSRADREPNETVVADPREVHREIVQRVRNALLASDVESRLSGQESDFKCWFFYPVDDDSSVDGRFLVTHLEWECNCTRADVS
jgi:hypothetical protein